MSTKSGVAAVFGLNRMGVEIMRANLRRRHPEATDAEIEQLLSRWVRSRPRAPRGDAEGVPTRRFD